MKKRFLALSLAAILASMLLAGCGAKSVYTSAPQEKNYAVAERSYWDSAPEAAEEELGYWADGDMAAEVPMPVQMSAGSAGTAGAAGAAEPARTPAKLIYTADLDMETLSFDEAVAALDQLTAEVGGYYESSSASDQGSYRWASFTVRVPAEQYRAFLDRAGERCRVRSQREYTEDVSESYYDTAGRLETQRTKLGRLQELLQQAESMEDIIVLESAISETEESIDRLSGTLRHYDALVEYSTVSIYLEEVKVYEPDPDPTYGVRLGTAFSEGLSTFVEGLGDILVALAYGWLWLVLIAAVVALILLLTRKRRAERRQERAARRALLAQKANTPAPYSTPGEPERPEK